MREQVNLDLNSAGRTRLSPASTATKTATIVKVPFSMSSQTRSIEVKNFPVRLDRIAFRFPGGQFPRGEFDPEEKRSQRPMQNRSAGLFTGASTVHDGFPLMGDQRWISEHLVRRNPPCARNNLRVG